MTTKQNELILSSHFQSVHDIGDNTCAFCYEKRQSSIAYRDAQGNHKICRKCFKAATGKDSRVEIQWSKYLDSRVGEEYLLGSDKSLKSLGGCQSYRPDKLYIGVDLVEVDECDEHQHAGSSYSCEEKRISDIYDEPAITGKRMVVIRLNPHAYKVQDGEVLRTPSFKPPQKERFELHAKLKEHLRENFQRLRDKIHIYYLFYSPDNESISHHIPHTLVYSEEDFPFVFKQEEEEEEVEGLIEAMKEMDL